MSNRIQIGLQKTLASVTMVATMLSLGGYAALPTIASAVAPADYGLTEGDTISATGSNDPDIYIVNQAGYKRVFVNPAIFNLYGHLGWDKVKSVASTTRDAFGTSAYFKNCENGDPKVYALEVVSEDVANLHWVDVSGSDAVSQDPNFFAKVFCINNNEQALYGTGSAYTSLSQVPVYVRGGTSTTSPSGLNGNAGSIEDADWVSSLSGEEVGEGADNVQVAGLDLDADNGSDIRLLSAKVSFEEQGGGGSVDLDDYIGEVSVWLGSTKVGEADVDEFSEDADVWSKTISFTGDPVIRMDGTGALYFAISANDTIDGTDLGANDWELSVENIRFVDAQGAITTEDDEGDIGASPEARAFSFETFATAEDLELELKEASDNPEEDIVKADDSSNTDGVVLLSVTQKADGGDVNIDEITVLVAYSGTGDIIDQASSFTLEVDGEEVESIDSADCDDFVVDCTDPVEEYTFDDLDYDLDDGDTIKVRVLADINEVDGVAFFEGDGLSASIDNDDTVAEDQSGEDLSAAELTGAITGEEQTFFTEGLILTFVSASESLVANDASPDVGTFVLKFKAMAFETDVYVQEDCSESAGTDVDFALDVGPALDCTVTSTADDDGVNGNFEVLEGSDEEFTLTVTTAGTDAYEQLSLLGVDWSATDIADPADVYDTNLDDFETDPLFLSSL